MGNESLSRESRLDVLLPSSYFCDLVFTGLPHLPRLGDEVYCQNFEIVPGAGFIPAVALNRLGLKVGWACDFGNDFFSRYTLEIIRQMGMDDSLFRYHDAPLRSVTVSYSFSHERAFLSYTDPLPEWDLLALIRQAPAKLLMLMGFPSRADIQEIAQAVHAQGGKVFLDCQAHKNSLDDPQVVQTLRAVDVFAPNQEEAFQLTGEKNVEAALERLAGLAHLVVIKMGKDGAIARRGSEVIHAPGAPVACVDTTGAGDNFDCGFVYGMLRGYSLLDSLRCGNICGGLSTTTPGGWQNSPPVALVESWLEQMRSADPED